MNIERPQKSLDKWIIRKRKASKKSTLNEAILELKRNKNMKKLNKKWIYESDQAYAYPISIPEGSNVLKLILIAKGSKLYQDRISIKRYLLEDAKYNHLPILLAWKVSDFPRIRYYIYDADWIFKYISLDPLPAKFPFDSLPVEFPSELGEEWTFDDKIQSVLKKLEKRKAITKLHNFVQTSMTNFSKGDLDKGTNGSQSPQPLTPIRSNQPPPLL